ncbi:MAG TPA: zinc ribbon domain-containing protein [Syntrophaceticus sp.]|nr:zinc ribbon domain-containing protein [Syntrophaceticus sp.]
MPTYEFECQKCGNRFSLFTTVSGRLKAVCPACQSGNLQQLFTGVSFVKGSSGGDSAGGSAASGGCSRGSCGGCSGC